jgi:hypothetical protein
MIIKLGGWQLEACCALASVPVHNHTPHTKQNPNKTIRPNIPASFIFAYPLPTAKMYPQPLMFGKQGAELPTRTVSSTICFALRESKPIRGSFLRGRAIRPYNSIR